jgi:hypothetical protein
MESLKSPTIAKRHLLLNSRVALDMGCWAKYVRNGFEGLLSTSATSLSKASSQTAGTPEQPSYPSSIIILPSAALYLAIFVIFASYIAGPNQPRFYGTRQMDLPRTHLRDVISPISIRKFTVRDQTT